MLRKMKKKRLIQGTVIKIPIGDGFHCYGRLLTKPTWEVFDYRTKENATDIERITSQTVLFTICIHTASINQSDWEVVGRSRGEDLDARIPLQFSQNRSDPTDCKVLDRFDNFFPATIEDCRGLERIVNWDPHHVVDRIRDHYAGVPNVWVELYRVREIGEEEI